MKDFQKNYILKVETHIRKFYSVSPQVALFIACQFALESSFGTSNIAVNLNNHCGMKNPLIRPSTACLAGVSNEKTFFAEYDSFEMCVVDYFLCIAFHKPMRADLVSVDSFACWIKWYCPDIDYSSRIMRLYNVYLNL